MFLNLYQRQCSNVLKCNTEAHVSSIFFQSTISVVFPEKRVNLKQRFSSNWNILYLDFLQAGHTFLSFVYFQT